MKHRYLVMTCCAILLVGLVGAPKLETVFAQQANSTGEMIVDTTNADPNFDARAALGDEVLQALANASYEAAVSHNGQTDETTITEPSSVSAYSAIEIAPHIPDGLEVAVPQSLKSNHRSRQ